MLTAPKQAADVLVAKYSDSASDSASASHASHPTRQAAHTALLLQFTGTLPAFGLLPMPKLWAFIPAGNPGLQGPIPLSYTRWAAAIVFGAP